MVPKNKKLESKAQSLLNQRDEMRAVIAIQSDRIETLKLEHGQLTVQKALIDSSHHQMLRENEALKEERQSLRERVSFLERKEEEMKLMEQLKWSRTMNGLESAQNLIGSEPLGVDQEETSDDDDDDMNGH